jgi:hypothetical protein
MTGRTVLRTAVLGGALAAARWARRDVRAWRALGPGGLPPTWWGWVRMSALRVLATLPAPTAGTAAAADPTPTVEALPGRATPRPRVAPYPVPHRVLDQRAPAALVAALQRELEALAGRDGLQMATSRWERHHVALWSDTDDEIAHVHPVDGSCHVVLAPADHAVVLARGWGVVHPLAGRGGLPRTYTLLFPPRDPTEAENVVAVLRAAVAGPDG